MITIIPAIDIINGKCVRLTQGDYKTSKVYHENPLKAARFFEKSGIKRLHLVDLEGARGDSIVNLDVLNTIAKETHLVIDFGGGIKNEESLLQVFQNGAAFATIGSVAVKNQIMVKSWIEKYGAHRFIIGIDTLHRKIKTKGWTESNDIPVSQIIKYYEDLGVRSFMITDISKDGKMEGTNITYYADLQKEYPALDIIASGGVSSIRDIEKLNSLGIYGVVLGKAIYEKRLQIKELQKYL